jgi:hypothetical protein
MRWSASRPTAKRGCGNHTAMRVRNGERVSFREWRHPRSAAAPFSQSRCSLALHAAIRPRRTIRTPSRSTGLNVFRGTNSATFPTFDSARTSTGSQRLSRASRATPRGPVHKASPACPPCHRSASAFAPSPHGGLRADESLVGRTIGRGRPLLESTGLGARNCHEQGTTTQSRPVRATLGTSV